MTENRKRGCDGDLGDRNKKVRLALDCPQSLELSLRSETERLRGGEVSDSIRRSLRRNALLLVSIYIPQVTDRLEELGRADAVTDSAVPDRVDPIKSSSPKDRPAGDDETSLSGSTPLMALDGATSNGAPSGILGQRRVDGHQNSPLVDLRRRVQQLYWEIEDISLRLLRSYSRNGCPDYEQIQSNDDALKRIRNDLEVITKATVLTKIQSEEECDEVQRIFYVIDNSFVIVNSPLFADREPDHSRLDRYYREGRKTDDLTSLRITLEMASLLTLLTQVADGLKMWAERAQSRFTDIARRQNVGVGCLVRQSNRFIETLSNLQHGIRSAMYLMSEFLLDRSPFFIGRSGIDLPGLQALQGAFDLTSKVSFYGRVELISSTFRDLGKFFKRHLEELEPIGAMSAEASLMFG